MIPGAAAGEAVAAIVGAGQLHLKLPPVKLLLVVYTSDKHNTVDALEHAPLLDMAPLSLRGRFRSQ